MSDPAKADPDPLPDAALRRFLGYGVRRATMVIQADLARTLAPFDLRMPTFSALAVIDANPGLRQAQLADILSIERPNLVLILDELEGHDWITRDRLANDRRAYALNITMKGSFVYSRAVEAVRAHDARMAAGLTDAERTLILSALHRIEQTGAKGGS